MRLSITYANNSAEAGETDFDIEVTLDTSTAEILLEKASRWLKREWA